MSAPKTVSTLKSNELLRVWAVRALSRNPSTDYYPSFVDEDWRHEPINAKYFDGLRLHSPDSRFDGTMPKTFTTYEEARAFAKRWNNCKFNRSPKHKKECNYTKAIPVLLSISLVKK